MDRDPFRRFNGLLKEKDANTYMCLLTTVSTAGFIIAVATAALPLPPPSPPPLLPLPSGPKPPIHPEQQKESILVSGESHTRDPKTLHFLQVNLESDHFLGESGFRSTSRIGSPGPDKRPRYKARTLCLHLLSTLHQKLRLSGLPLAPR